MNANLLFVLGVLFGGFLFVILPRLFFAMFDSFIRRKEIKESKKKAKQRIEMINSLKV